MSTKLISVAFASSLTSPGAATTYTIEVDGVMRRVRGVGRGLIDVTLPVVALYAEGSLPREGQCDWAADAESNFEEAVTELVRTGQSFYTALRPEWSLPMLRWQLVD